jgi:hypothetical protein
LFRHTGNNFGGAAFNPHLPTEARCGRGDEFPMKILFVTSEFADFAKAGGLADVAAA